MVLSPCLVLYEKKVCQILKVHVHNHLLYKGQAQSTTITQHLDGILPFLQNSHWEPVFPDDRLLGFNKSNKSVFLGNHLHGFHQQQTCFRWWPFPWFPPATTSLFPLATISMVSINNNKCVFLSDHLPGYHHHQQACFPCRPSPWFPPTTPGAAVHAGSLWSVFLTHPCKRHQDLWPSDTNLYILQIWLRFKKYLIESCVSP